MDKPDSSARQAPDTPADARALQRRLLLRGVAAGGALVGAAAPLTAHATGKKVCVKSSKNYNATASAVGSMVGSAAAVTTPVAGHKCSHYTNSSNWTSGWHNGKGRSVSYNLCANPSAGTRLRFFHVFELSNPGSGQKYRECQDIIRNDSTSAEAHWLTALFNANKRGTSGFTYTPGGVVDLYKGLNPLTGGSAQAGIDAKALQLFRDYLSDLI